jgi:RNA polymerase sigma-70 factor, ECF subfamily
MCDHDTAICGKRDASAELAALLDGVHHHDPTAARELVERLYPLVLKIVRAHRPQRMSEEDLCQEVFMSVFADLDQFRGTMPFEHWVSRVTVHTCIDQLRRQRARPELRWADLPREEAELLQAMAADQSEPCAEHTLANRELVGRLLDALPPKDRLLMQWLELEDRSVNEVATLTGWSKTLVKVRAFRARRRMRQTLERILRQEIP